MSKFDEQSRKRLIKANDKIKDIQRKLESKLLGCRVRLNNERRGSHSRRRYKEGTEFIVYDVLVDGRDIGLWLSRVQDKDNPKFEMSVWLREVEFLPETK